MRQQLEILTGYQPTREVERGAVYVIGDLERLSATTLWYGEGAPSAANSSGYAGSDSISKAALTEAIARYGDHTVKTYVDPVKNEVRAREQQPGEAHRDQMKHIVIDKAK